MKVEQIYWTDNQLSEKVRKELRLGNEIITIFLITFFSVFAIFDPLGFGKGFIPLMGIVILIALFLSWYGHHFLPTQIGFTENGIYLKTAKSRQKFISWQRISGFSKNGEYLLYSCWYLYGANNHIRLFSEAREESKKYWEKYHKQKERLKKDKQQQIRRQIFAVSFFFILSVILTIYMIIQLEPLINISILLFASIMLAFVIYLLVHNYRKFNETSNSILERR